MVCTSVMRPVGVMSMEVRVGGESFHQSMPNSGLLGSSVTGTLFGEPWLSGELPYPVAGMEAVRPPEIQTLYSHAGVTGMYWAALDPMGPESGAVDDVLEGWVGPIRPAAEAGSSTCISQVGCCCHGQLICTAEHQLKN